MSALDKDSLMRKVAVGLIICAVVGTEISYHFTLESRFGAIEEKLLQENTAMQEMQQSLDALAASKTETISGLNKQLATLQQSFEPLGKNTKEQAESLDKLRQQLASLQQAQAGQQEAQKRVSDYLTQLELSVKKAHAEAEVAKPAPVVTAPASNMPVAVPIPPAPAATISAPASNAAPSASASELLSSPGEVGHGTPTAVVEPRAQAVDPAQLTTASPNAGTGVVLRSAEATASDAIRASHSHAVGAAFSTK